MTEDHQPETDPATVLLLAPDIGSTAGEVVAAALEERPDRVVAVTVAGTAERWLDGWRRSASSSPATSVTCVDVAGDTRSVTAEAERLGDDHDGTGVAVERVRDPTALEELGRTVSDVLQRADEADERVAVVVHTLSDLCTHVDEATAFKFVYTLGEVVDRVDAAAYFHLDPAAGGPETVETFSVVCDDVVELDARSELDPSEQ